MSNIIDNRTTMKLIDNLPVKNLMPPHVVPAFDVGIEEVVEKSLPPQQSGDIGYTKLREFSFEVASDNEILSGDVDLHFKVTASAACTLTGNAKTFFDVCSVKKKYGALIEELPLSGIYSQINDTISNGAESCLRKVAMGQDDCLKAVGNRKPLASGAYYKIPIDLSILRQNQWIHLPKTGPLIFTFRCADNATPLYHASNTPTLTFTEVKLVIRTKKMSPGWIEKEILKSAPIKYNFERVQYYTGKWNGSYNQIELHKDCRSAHTLIVRFRKASQFNSYTNNNTNKSICPVTYPFTKISLTHNGKELRADPLIVNNEYMLEELFRVWGLRNDNDNGSLVKRSNYGCADADAEAAWTLASDEISCPQYYLVFDLTRNGINSGIDLLNGGNLIFSTLANSPATELDYVDCFLVYSSVCVVHDKNNLEVKY